MTAHPRATWRTLITADGSPTLVHPGHGEACHSSDGAWLEAVERYARPCRLAERAGPGIRLGLLDIGTGLGLNLAAALEAVEGAGGALAAVSLELEPGVLEAALALPEGPPAWGPVRGALARALARPQEAAGPGLALGARSRLHLVLGDARESLPALPDELRFDAVFLDPFSPRVAPELWQPAFLAEVARRLAPGSWLSTYTVSVPVRAALFEAGLRVGSGGRVGRKAAGTLASPDLEPPPLDARTARKLERRARERPQRPI